MTPLKVYNGQLITSTATEQGLEPNGGFDQVPVVVQCEVVSGTLKFGVGPAGGDPVIDGSLGTWGSYTTSNSKTLRTVQPGISNLRVVGVGTFIISW
jgi:hypothetical protein